jgi:transcriptional regulator with XRE-family HTH domain
MELSKALDIGRPQIANVEGGRSDPSFDLLIRIADYFETTTDYLVGRSTP